MQVKNANLLKKLISPAGLSMAKQIGTGLLGSAAIGGAAPIVYRAGTGEELSPAARLAAYGLGGGAASGKLGPLAKTLAASAMLSGATVQGIDHTQRRNLGFSMMDPKSVMNKTKQTVIDQASDTRDKLLAHPRIQQLMANPELQKLLDLSPVGSGFQFSSLHSMPDVNRRALQRSRDYMLKHRS